MASDNFNLHRSVGVDTSKLGVDFTSGFLEEGWGVFKVSYGIMSPNSRSLQKVFAERSAADAERDRRSEVDGVMEYEVADDPETSIYRAVSFTVGYVTLIETVVDPHIHVDAKYVGAPLPTAQPEA